MFKFSKRSKQHLDEVNTRLVVLAKRALELSEVDFGITDGLRSVEEQIDLVASGASKTMKSKHLTGAAIDVMAYIGTRQSWDWPLYERIAYAFKEASEELDIPVRWGGCWRVLSEVDNLEDAVLEYVNRKRLQGKKALMDGPHFELA